MSDILHDMRVVLLVNPTDTTGFAPKDVVFGVNIKLPGYGTIIVTFESDPEMNRGPVPVVATDFEPSAITVIDQQGQPRLISV